MPDHPPSKPLYGWGVGWTTHPANLFMGGGWAGPPTQETSPACTDPPSPDPRFLLLFPRFCSPVAGFFFRFFMFPRRVLVHVSDVGLRLVLLFTCCSQPWAWASLGEVSRCPGSGAFMWVVVFCVSKAAQRAAAAKIWVHVTSCRPPRGTQLELAADLGLILTAIGAV